jgi:hypothetical protein
MLVRVGSDQNYWLTPTLGDYTPSSDAAIGQGLTNAYRIGASTGASTGSAVAGGIASALSIASAFDPEPISRSLLAIGAALTGIITRMAQGCGQTCIDASNYVNEAEPYFVQNVATYTGSPVRTQSMQRQALANFDNAFTALVQKCQQIGGAGGTNCVKDRTSGACKWHATPWTWTPSSDGTYTYTPAGSNGSGSQCWNWVYGYRDCIAADPGLVADSVVSSTGSASGLVSTDVSGNTTIAGIPAEYVLIGALLVGAVLL